MYLAELHIENFRAFGAVADNEHLDLVLLDGLNALVGENDSGKSSIVDAIRLLMSARGQDALRLDTEDFHVRKGQRAATLTVRGTFKGLTDEEKSRFLEWLSFDGDAHALVITLSATRREVPGRSRRVFVTTKTGRNADGPPFEGEVRDFLQPTYLRPLRDAEAELAGRRGSRLSQILEAHPLFKEHDIDDSEKNSPPETLLGIMRKAERDVADSKIVRDTADRLTTEYLKPLSIGTNSLSGAIGIARDVELRHILEKLELWLNPDDEGGTRVRRGLGLNNILFMAAEFLMLTGDPTASLGLLLVEEPEAHLHPQLQARLIEFLEKRSATRVAKKATDTHDPVSSPEARAQEAQNDAAAEVPVQVLLTTHSPHFASKIDLERLILMCRRRCFSLAKSHTKLGASDYEFLRRFLDVTKANLFFARGVLIVEGDGENLLLPAIASKIGRPLAEHGVSVVNVGSRALARYARIFQRQSGPEIDVRVACVTDLDLVPSEIDYVKAQAAEEDDDDNEDDGEESPKDAKKDPPTPEARTASLQKNDQGPLKTFVSPHWTLEHDLARSGLASLVHEAIVIGRKSKNRRSKGRQALSEEEKQKATKKARAEFTTLSASVGGDPAKLAARIYKPLYLTRASKAEVAELLADLIAEDARSAREMRRILPSYLVEAIDYVTRNDDQKAP